MATKVVVPSTSDEIHLAKICMAGALAGGATEDQCYRTAATDYTIAVLGNLAKFHDPNVPTLQLLGRVTPEGMKRFWMKKTDEASALLVGDSANPVRGAVRGRGRGARGGHGAGWGRDGSSAGRGRGAGGASGAVSGTSSPSVAHSSPEAQGDVFFMDDETIDSLSARKLKRTLREIEGEGCRNDVKAPELRIRLKEAAKQRKRRRLIL